MELFFLTYWVQKQKEIDKYICYFLDVSFF